MLPFVVCSVCVRFGYGSFCCVVLACRLLFDLVVCGFSFGLWYSIVVLVISFGVVFGYCVCVFSCVALVSCLGLFCYFVVLGCLIVIA